MKKKDIKAFQGLEAVLDENYKMLCDRVKKLEKSHKRMVHVMQTVRGVLSRDVSFYKVGNTGLCVDFRVSDALLLLNKELERKVL